METTFPFIDSTVVSTIVSLIVLYSLMTSGIYFHRWLFGKIGGFARNITLGISISSFGISLFYTFILLSLFGFSAFSSYGGSAMQVFLLFGSLGTTLTGFGLYLSPLFERYLGMDGRLTYGISVLTFFVLLFQINASL